MAIRNKAASKDRGRKKKCACCEKEFIYTNGNRKYCDACRAKTPDQRKALRFRLGLNKKAPPMSCYIECVICGKAVERTSPNRKYCEDCRAEVLALKNSGQDYGAGKTPKVIEPDFMSARSRMEAREAALLDYHDLSGKTADRISAEAAAFGFGASYGKYVACVRSGMIDRWLRDRGIYDPVAVLRGIKTK